MRIKDIAQMAGVSTAMVSRVINNTGYVAREKREKILKIIDETGFVLNQQARSLRTRQSNLIASVIPAFDSSYVLEVQEKVIAQLEKQGYHLLLTSWRRQDSSLSLAAILTSLVAAGVDAVVIFHDAISPEEKAAIQNCSVPVIVVDQLVEGVRCLFSAQKEAGALLMSTAISAGYRRIAYLDDVHLKEARGMEMAARGSQTCVEICPIPFSLALSHAGQIPQIGQYIEKMERKPDIFLSFSDRIAIGVSNWAAAAGLQMAAAGIGNTALTALSQPPICTVDLHSSALADEICASIHRLLNGQSFENWVWKNTCSLVNPQNLARVSAALQ